MESDSDWEQQQRDARADSSSGRDQEESDTASEQRSRSLQGRHRRKGSAGPPAIAAAATAAAAGAQQGDQQGLHAPFSHLLWSDSVVAQSRFRVANSLCTDIAGDGSSSWTGTAAVQVTVEVHAASWDVRQYILSQLQQQAPAGRQQQQGQPPVSQAGSTAGGSPKVFGPYAATLSKDKNNKQLSITQMQHQHDPQTYLQHLAGKSHRVVLQGRVPGSDPPHFKMHLKPGTPAKLGNQDSKAISRAGEGPGLQVAPGSVSEVINSGEIKSSGRKLDLYIPKVLICSQLPADTTYPLDISLRVLPPPDGQQGQWAVRVYPTGDSIWRVRLGAGHPLSAYVGRSISKMSLSQDRQLTLTIATPSTVIAPAATPQQAIAAAYTAVASAGMSQDAPAAAATPPPPAMAPAAAVSGSATQQPQSWLHLKRRAPAGSGEQGQQQQQQQQLEAGTDGGRSAAAAAAAAGGTSGPAAAVGRNKAKRVRQQQQQQVALAAAATTTAAADAAAGAVPPPKHSASRAARAQRAAVRAASEAAAADRGAPSATPARKKRRQTQQQQEQERVAAPEAAGASAAAAEPPAAPVPIKQEPDSSTPPPAAATNTGLMFWHLGELSSSSSGEEGEDGSLDEDTKPAAAGPTAGSLQGVPAVASLGAAAVDPSPAPTEPVASTSHGNPQGVPAVQASAAAFGSPAVGPAVPESVTPAAETAPPAPPAAPAPVVVTAAATQTPAPASAPLVLPAGLTLPPASSPAEVSMQLMGLMVDGLMPLLDDPSQYDSLMQQLSDLFMPDRQPPVDGAVLSLRYQCVRAAVGSRRLARVVEEVEKLIRACGG